MRRIQFVLGVVALQLMAILALAQDGTIATKDEPPYDLDKVRYMDGFVGSPGARKTLASQGFVVTDQQFLQIFEAYLSLGAGQAVPKFITVDSAWHTYHVLLEDGVRSLELGQAAILRRFSERLYKTALARKEGADAAYQDVATFAAVGLALQDPSAIERLPGEHRAKVQAVLEIIRRGGPPSSGVLFFSLPLMPEQFRAVSFYTKTPELSRYFSARQWYATRVFRLDSDVETVRALALTLLVDSDAELKKMYDRLTAPYDEMVGPSDDPGLAQYAQALSRAAGGLPPSEKIAGLLSAFRREASRLPGPEVNDQWLAPGDYHAKASHTKGMRVLGPRRLPSAVLFQNTVDPAVRGRMSPSGLDVFAAGPLACEAGQRALRKAIPNPALADAVSRANSGPLPNSLHGEAMRLLQLLQTPLPATAPAALRTPAWHDKQLATALAAWAEERHTWALQAKMTLHYGCATREPAGYVSPYPDFYRGLAKLARRAAADLRQASAGPDLVTAGRAWLALEEKQAKKPSDTSTISMEDIQDSNQRTHVLQLYFTERGKNVFSANAEEFAEASEAIRAAAQRCAEDKGVTEADRRYMTAFTKAPEGEAMELLPEFAVVCERLADMAQKELDGKPLDRQDARFIQDYGMTLARFHFYGGNSYVTPRDDHPIVTPVYSSPTGNRSESLYVGIGRPEAIYVIVFDGQQPVLHRGAVLAYREFLRPLDRPLDDYIWGQEIRAGNVPPPLPFTASFRQPITEKEVAALIRAGKSYPTAGVFPGREITTAMIESINRKESRSGRSHDFYDQLKARISAEDVPALLKVIHQAPNIDVTDLALCLEAVDWGPHSKAIMELLRSERAPCADTAAYLFAKRPDLLNATELLNTYRDQRPRTRRLYCWLAGTIKKPGDQAVGLLEAALEDADDGVRFEAAGAIVRCGAGTPQVVERLIRGMHDKNSYVAGAMVHALAELKIDRTAAAMYELLKGEASRDYDAPDYCKQLGAVKNATRYGGSVAIMVLERMPSFNSRGPSGNDPIKSLRWELIHAMGAFRYAPATEQLLGMLHGKVDERREDRDGARIFWPDDSAKVLEAILEIQPERKAELLVQVVQDRHIAGWTRSLAVDLIVKMKDPRRAKDLLPLLDDVSSGPFVNDIRICDVAADAIARLLTAAGQETTELRELRKSASTDLRRALRHPHSTRALDALVTLGAVEESAFLLDVACDPTCDVSARKQALSSLGEKGNLEAVPRLLPLLKDESGGNDEGESVIGQCAAEAIANLFAKPPQLDPGREVTRKMAEPHLRAILGGRCGKEAMEALATMDPKGASQLYVEIALDRQKLPGTRIAALRAIAESETPIPIERLLPLLEDAIPDSEGGQHDDNDEPQEVCQVAARVIGTLCQNLNTTIPLQAETFRVVRSRFDTILHGADGLRAIAGLIAMSADKAQQAETALGIASDRSLSYAVRRRALEYVARMNDRSCAKKLLPLLNDKTHADHDGLSIGEHAANTIAELAGKRDMIDEDTPTEIRAKFMEDVRGLAGKE